MRTILVANPKGGSGKTTLATNIAGWLAGKRQRVGLLDADAQGSATQWLARRPTLFPPVAGFAGDVGKKELKDVAPEWLVVDSPAAVHGDALRDAVKRADAMIVPVSPSVFDMAATSAFLQILMEEKAIRKHKTFVGIVGMRVDPRTKAAATLEAFLAQFKLPVLTYLRDTQVYVNAAFNGLSVFDLPDYVSARDLDQWQPLLDWLEED